jgi:hypothetical protein
MHIINADCRFDKEKIYNRLNVFYNGKLEANVFEHVYKGFMESLNIKAGYAEFPEIASTACAVLYTLGEGAEWYISDYFDKGESGKGYMADLIANECMFELGDNVFKAINEIEGGIGFIRLAPFDNIEACMQKKIIDTVDIGVSCNEYFVLNPIKSAAFVAVRPGTAIKGLGCRFNEKFGLNSCETCEYRRLPY